MEYKELTYKIPDHLNKEIFESLRVNIQNKTMLKNNRIKKSILSELKSIFDKDIPESSQSLKIKDFIRAEIIQGHGKDKDGIVGCESYIKKILGVNSDDIIDSIYLMYVNNDINQFWKSLKHHSNFLETTDPISYEKIIKAENGDMKSLQVSTSVINDYSLISYNSLYTSDFINKQASRYGDYNYHNTFFPIVNRVIRSDYRTNIFEYGEEEKINKKFIKSIYVQCMQWLHDKKYKSLIKSITPTTSINRSGGGCGGGGGGESH